MFSRMVLIVCFTSMIAQYAFFRDFNGGAGNFGICYSPVVDSGQIYRVVTSEFTHGSIMHILFNSSAIVAFGQQIESIYGTLFFAILNIWLMLISQALSLLSHHAMIFWMPVSVGGHDQKWMISCSVGYSNILFGVLMIGSLQGSKYINMYGCQFPKALLPLLLLIISRIMVPNSDILGHSTGILAALIIKFCGLYNAQLLPKYKWIQAFEQ